MIFQSISFVLMVVVLSDLVDGRWNKNQGGWNNNNGGGNNNQGGWNNNQGGGNNNQGGWNNNKGGGNNNQGGWNNNQGGWNNQQGGWNNNQGGWNNNKEGGNNNQGGWNNNKGGWDNNQGGWDNNQGGWDNNQGGWDNNQGEGDNNQGGWDNNKPDDETPSPEAPGGSNEAPSSGWKADVLKRHNELRAKLAQGKQANMAPAKYMAKMVWDDQLAAQAQAYTDTCSSGHDPNKGKVGENWAGNSRENSWNTMVDGWYNEVQEAPRVTESDSGKFYQKGIGHFTQIVWAQSKYLGCGYTSKCGSRKKLICRYKPRGNYNTRTTPVYVPGKTCQLCDGNCDNGLCDGGMKRS